MASQWPHCAANRISRRCALLRDVTVLDVRIFVASAVCMADGRVVTSAVSLQCRLKELRENFSVRRVAEPELSLLEVVLMVH